MKLYVITGASRGLGAALATALIAPGHRLICLARGPMAAIERQAVAQGCAFDAVRIDLRDAAAAVAALEARFSDVDVAALDEACLINNAGTVEPVRPVDRLLPEEIAAAVTLNVAAPIALTAAFLRLTAGCAGARKVVNISSGAAYKPYDGWSVYCATKAALDHFSRCLAEEQQAVPRGARVVSLAPGIIDTAMQALIRNLPVGDFKNQQYFVGLKQSGGLDSPEFAAARIIEYMARSDFGERAVADVRDA